MPNRPDNPYERVPLTAVVGLLLMVSGALALLFLSSTWQDWRQASLGAVLLFGLIGTVLMLRRLKRWPFAARGARNSPVLEIPEPAAVQAFDPAGFIEAARQRHQASPPRRIEERRERDSAPDNAERRQAKQAGTIRRLQDLRDHPATPDAERQAAGEKVKKLRTKRRSAWRKRP